MRRWTETMVCCRCGRSFEHTFGDAIKPSDIEFMRHPLCNICSEIERLHGFIGKLIGQHPHG